MKGGVEVPHPELDVFAHPRIQKSVLQTIETKHRPTTALGDYLTKSGNEVEFNIYLADDEYLLLQETFIYIRCILQAKGAPLTVPVGIAEEVYPANYMLHTMIDRVRVSLGNNESGIDITSYGYKAYFETLLGYGEPAKLTHLRSAMWLEEKSERIAAVFSQEDDTKPLIAKPFEMSGRLHYDFLHQSKAIIGGCKVVIKISFVGEKFFLNTGSVKDVKLKFEDVFLKAKRYKVAPSIVSAHQKALSHTTAKYPLSTARINSMVVPRNSLFVGLDNVINGSIPNRIFFALVEKNDFAGDTESDPFEFKHQNVSSMTVFIDGVQLQSSPEIRAEFENNRVLETYDRLYDVLNQNDTDPLCSITLEEFVHNKCIFAFDLSQDHSSSDLEGHFNEHKTGSMRVEIRFAKETEKDCMLIGFCQYNKLYEIDKLRNLVETRQ